MGSIGSREGRARARILNPFLQIVSPYPTSVHVRSRKHGCFLSFTSRSPRLTLCQRPTTRLLASDKRQRVPVHCPRQLVFFYQFVQSRISPSHDLDLPSAAVADESAAPKRSRAKAAGQAKKASAKPAKKKKAANKKIKGKRNKVGWLVGVSNVV